MGIFAKVWPDAKEGDEKKEIFDVISGRIEVIVSIYALDAEI